MYVGLDGWLGLIIMSNLNLSWVKLTLGWVVTNIYPQSARIQPKKL